MSDLKEFELQKEIRKLKLELLKQELDDKLLTLKNYLEKKNETYYSTTLVVSSTTTKAESDPGLGSILFVNIFGNFEVWHFVLLALMVWFLFVICVGYLRKFLIDQQAKHKRKLVAKLKLREKEINKTSSNQKNLLNEANKIQKQVNSYPNYAFNDTLYAPRKDFCLYTIDEHEVVTNKTFSTTTRKNLNLAQTAKLSKSDTNLSSSSSSSFKK